MGKKKKKKRKERPQPPSFSVAALSLAERALLRRVVYEHPEAVRVDEADALLAEGLRIRKLLRPAAIGQRYCWRLHAAVVEARESLREALFPQ